MIIDDLPCEMTASPISWGKLLIIGRSVWKERI
jgi:hypothetical protein